MPNFFQKRESRKFDYQPRYYSPEKERLDNLKRKYGSGGDSDELADIKARMKQEFRAIRPERRAKNMLTRKKLYIYILLVLFILILFLR